MTTVTGALADAVSALGWHAWQASITGVVALALAAAVRRRAPRTGALIVVLALLKFLAPPVVRFPFALGDTAAIAVNPFALVPSGNETAGTGRAALAALAAGSLLATGLFALGVVRHAAAVGRLRRAAAPAADGPAAHALSTAADALRLRVRPVLLVSDVAGGPFATGVRRPAVVLPRNLVEQADPGALTIVIAHELAHHRRRDLAMAWCAAAVTAVFWFSPIVWVLARKLQELREDCCDAEVIRRGLATPEAYAEALLAAAEIHSGAAVLPMRDRHPLGRRIRRVLTQPAPLPLYVCAMVITVFVVGWLPSTTFKPVWGGDSEVRVERAVTHRADAPPPSADRIVRARR